MAIQILIGGTDYTNLVDLKSVKIDSNIAVNSDTADFDTLISQKTLPYPKGGQEVRILNGTVTEFGGVVIQSNENMITPDAMQYDTHCRDYVFWLNKRVVTNTYLNMSVSDIVKDIINRFTTGFTMNNVHTVTATINMIKFDHKSVSDCLDTLSKQIGYQWWVDYDKDIHFGPTGLIPSPLPNNALLADTDLDNYGDLTLTEDVTQIRNQVYIYGHKVAQPQPVTESFVADGQTTTFYSAYEPKHLLDSITFNLGGTAQKKGLDVVDSPPGSGVDGKVYVNYKNRSYRLKTAPAQGTVVSVTYYPMIETLKVYSEPNAQNVMKSRDGIDGVYEFGIRDPKLTSVDSSLADLRGQEELMQYAYPHYTGQFNSFLQGWQAGQYFYLTSNNRMGGIFQNYLFYVIKVEKVIVSHPKNGEPVFLSTMSISNTPYSN